MPETADEMTEAASPPDAPAAQPAETDWKAESRKWEQRAKENLSQVNALKPKADQFAALEEASKSDAQRLQDAAAAAQRDAEQARGEAIRYKAAATHGITADYFDLLGTGSEEEVMSNAAKVSALLAAQVAQSTPPTAQPPRRPVEQMQPGATPTGAIDEDEALFQTFFPGR